MDFCTGSWILNIVLFALGVTVLVKGSDLFVDAAAALARSFQVSELVIGLTLVSIGTSLPELASSGYAAWKGEGSFVMGNIVGSNIANIALILGIGVVWGGRIVFDQLALKRDMPVMLLVSLLLAGAFYFSRSVEAAGAAGEATGQIHWTIGILLLILTAGYLALLFCLSPQSISSEAAEEAELQQTPPERIWRLRASASAKLVLGLLLVVVGSKLMVDTVVWAARTLQVDALIISLTVVAVGTSLPELAVTVAGVAKGKNDMALGNIIGSCIFNILLIVGCCAVLAPVVTIFAATWYNLILMCGVGVLLLLAMLSGKGALRRWHGVIFLMIYLGFIAWNLIG